MVGRRRVRRVSGVGVVSSFGMMVWLSSVSGGGLPVNCPMVHYRIFTL